MRALTDKNRQVAALAAILWAGSPALAKIDVRTAPEGSGLRPCLACHRANAQSNRHRNAVGANLVSAPTPSYPHQHKPHEDDR